MTNNHGTGHDLPLTLTHLRLAVEQATKYLEADRPADALLALYAVEAPARTAIEIAACGAVCQRRNAFGHVFDRVVCYLPPNHYYAQRHEGSAVGVDGFQWDAATGTEAAA